MRTVLRNLITNDEVPTNPTLLPDFLQEPVHPGLVYDVYAPIRSEAAIETDEDRGKIPDDLKNAWLSKIADQGVCEDYPNAYKRWRDSFPGEKQEVVTFKSRLLIGHGNPSGSEVGLTVHRTWGVPVIPGSALKGLTAHYVETVYGPDRDNSDKERDDYRGVTWKERRIADGPGEVYRCLFGSPPFAKVESNANKADAGNQGNVVFHDALYVPGSCIDENTKNERPFATDVLTVHHKTYYDGKGATLPNDYDNPTPVGFLTVRPGAQFLIVITGLGDWPAFTLARVIEALGEWGVGAKTSLGYGRMISPG